MRMIRLTVIVLSLALVAGCAALKSAVSYPDASVADVRVDNVGLTALTLAFDIDVANPYTVTLPVLGLDFQLSSAGTEFLSGALDQNESIPAGESRRMAVPIRIPYQEIYSVISGVKKGSDVPYKADFGLHVDAPVLGRITIPLDAEGEIPIPQF